MRRAHGQTVKELAKSANREDTAQTNSESRYRRLFETAQDGILILDADTGEITDVNPFLENLLGYSHEEFLGKKLWDLGPFKDIEESRADFRELQKKEYIRYEDLPLQAKNGRCIDVEFVSNIYMVGRQRVIQCNIRDITERVHAENELKRNRDIQTVLISLLTLSLKKMSLKRFLKETLDLILSVSWLALEAKGGVFLVEGKPEILVLKAEKGLSTQILKSCSRISFGECLCGRAASEQKIQFADHVDERHEVAYKGIASHGHYCVPILSSGKALGVIVLYLRFGHRYDQKEENFLLAVADALAGTIQRKRAAEDIASTARFPSEDPSPVLRLSKDDILLYANEASLPLLKQWGGKVGDQVPVFWHDLTMEARVRKLQTTTEYQSGEKTFSFIIAPVPNESYVNLYGTDITKNKYAEKLIKKLSSAVEQTADNVFITDLEGVIEYVNPAFEKLTGYSKEEAIGKTPRILKSGMQSSKEYEELWTTILAGKVFQGELINRKKNGELYNEEKIVTPMRDERGTISNFVSTGKDITNKKRHELEMEAIATMSMAMRSAQTLEEMLNQLLDTTLELMHATLGAIWLHDPVKNELRTVVTRGWDIDTPDRCAPPEKPGEGLNGLVFTSGRAFFGSDYFSNKFLSAKIRRLIPPGLGGAVIPLCAGDKVIGTLNINVFSPRAITAEEVHLLTTLSEIAGNAIQRMRLYEMTKRDVRRFAALHSIDSAINKSVDLPSTLSIILKHVVALLDISAADILLFNPQTLKLEYSAGTGFHTTAIEHSSLAPGEGYAGKAALKLRTFNVPDLRKVGSKYARQKLLLGEGFISYFGVPLIAKDKVIGVLDIFSRTLLAPKPEWLDFMEALASQAAIAIDNASLFANLQLSNIELSQAYDATIEGWSHAMDLRDKETEGHTQRVSNLTVELARKVGIANDEIVHIRRGALLHDMGKMGVPDSILLKPGALTDTEWVEMRRHPQYAHDMLSKIVYLRPALDIPYCHHEKWDGSGYPRGLKGEAIPLAARLFAVVDVWDALRSDRPYRKAWDKKKVLEHIKSLSGSHFDPKAVEAFLEMI
jgi:PAS domain S-box-containing protein